MKETHYKLKHRVTALFAAAVMLCSMLPGAAFAEEPTPQPTEETAQMEQQTEPSETDNGQTDESSPDPGEDVTEATPETAEEQPAEEEISAAVVGAELYTDLPDAPIGSYIGSEGLPVATGETKIGISEWPESQLEEGGSYLTAVALDNDGLTMAAPLLDGADYAIVPIMAQVEYPADGSSTDMILPDGVTLLDFYGEPATDADALLHNSYHETSAAVIGVYVQAAADFNAQLVYTGPDGSTQTKTLYVTIDREHTVASPFADAGIAAYGERPIPDVTSGKITKVAKVNGTWLIWFNGEPAYCCTPGADGQPKNCPTYTYVNTSMVGADQYVPGDHYGNQYRIWGGLTQLSLGMQELPPVALSAEAPSLLDSCRTIYTDAQMQIIENYRDKKLFSQYSLGMKQRLAIALAVMHNPELLILDEPINGLDPIGIAEVRDFIRELCDTSGKTILISSHILSEISLLADDVGIIDHGKLLEEESLKELEAKNAKFIHFCVSDAQKAAKIIAATFHSKDFRLTDANNLYLYDMTLPVERINRSFVESGIEIQEVHLCEDTLEDYFKKITGGEGIA